MSPDTKPKSLGYVNVSNQVILVCAVDKLQHTSEQNK